MRKWYTAAMIAVILASGASSAYADKPYFYAGHDSAVILYSAPFFVGNVFLSAVYIKGGAVFNKYVAVEFRTGLGLTKGRIETFSTAIDVKLKAFAGAYIRVGVPTKSRVYPYAILGYSRGRLDASGLGFSVSDIDSDVSYGAGMDIRLLKHLSLNLEYAVYLDKVDAHISAFSIGLIHNFMRR